MIITKPNSYIADNVHIKDKLSVGFCSIIGNEQNGDTYIGLNCNIGDFCKVDHDVVIGDDATIEDYCSIYKMCTVGNGFRMVSGSRIAARCSIGNNVIINGIVSQRVIIEDDVRFFGRTVHSHLDHTKDWKTTVEPSPILKRGCIVGVNAMIMGGIIIGENSYVAAGEIVKCNVPADKVYINGKIIDKIYFRGFIK